ncbi:uncharacterized protein LOC116210182 [Punica granatum]|uniref:Uncharacterized protein LOC116210182 n=1 Tax=Punica granatum TaxID=22663 RepID=A0A218X750_PUNGR|nr:uncharacterized protein LOC116210182 [Punica granatum]OWM80608.1 hypothetical protein CDL15_Pgr006638 [Punica granatum]
MSRRSNSDHSTGHESSWTKYLDESSASERWTERRSGFSGGQKEEQQHEEENLSMVSDASSGPPHCKSEDSCNDENECSSSFFASTGTNAKTRNEKNQQKDKCANKNGGKRSTSSSLHGKSEFMNYRHDTPPLIAGKAASGKPGRSKGNRK